MLEKLKPFQNIGPGDFIKEELEVRGWQQSDLADILGVSKKHVNKLINNKHSITIETAKLLSKAFGQSPQYWINLDTNYRLRMDNSLLEDNVETKANVYKYMPINEMVKKGWLRPTETMEELIVEVKKFWEKEELDFSFLDAIVLPNFRKSEAYNKFNQYYALTWFQMAKNSSKLYDVCKYNKDQLSDLSMKLSAFSNKQEGIPLFIHELNNAGVKFLVISHLQKTYTDGASFFDGSHPVIVYTSRHDRNDNFWFTMVHEIGHVFLHIKNENDFFIDESNSLQTGCEIEADNYAKKILKVSDILKFFERKSSYITKTNVITCSTMLNINEAIVVGVLQHHGKLKHTHLNGLKQKASNSIPHQSYPEKNMRT